MNLNLTIARTVLGASAAAVTIALAGGTAFAGTAVPPPVTNSAITITATTPAPPEVQCQTAFVDGIAYGPYIGDPGAAPGREIGPCITPAFQTNVGPVIQVRSPYDGGPRPVYLLRPSRPQIPVTDRAPIPTYHFKTLECSHVGNRLVPGVVNQVPPALPVTCKVHFYQLVPHADGAIMVLTWGTLHTAYSIGPKVNNKITWKKRIPLIAFLLHPQP